MRQGARVVLKASHSLTQQEVVGNLTYLISHGWVAEERVEKSVTLRSGVVVPQSTAYYGITAEGIDKIEGPSEYTMKKFHGINIEATGQNIITVGDGNEVNVRYRDAVTALANLKEALLKSDLGEEAKLNVVADIDTIQSQLAKAQPNRAVIREVWEGITQVAVAVGLGADVYALGELIAPLLS